MNAFRLREWLVEPSLGRLSNAEGEVRLEPRVAELLNLLAQRPGTVVTKDAILGKLWGGAHVVDDVLTRAVSQLRLALGDDPKAPRFIETIPKRGYRLIASVERNWETTSTKGIVVLPFKDMSGAAGSEHVALGVTELLTAHLSRIHSLRVISGTTAARCAARGLQVSEIVRELDVQFVVEGALARSGTELLVVVKLIEASSDSHIWSKELRGSDRDMLQIETEVARSIAREIAVELTPGEANQLSAARKGNPEAHDLYLRGLYHWSKRSPVALRAAVACFEKAVTADAEFALAQAALANSFIVMMVYGLMPAEEALERAGAHGRRALELDDDLGEAHTARGGVKLFGEFDYPAAELSFRRAIALSPSATITRLAFTDLLSAQGRHAEALHQISIAVAINPFDVGMLMNQGDHLVFAGRVADALAPLRQAVEMEPQLPRPRERLIRALALANRLPDALEQFRRAKQLSHDFPALESYVLALAGQRAEAEQLVARFEHQPRLLQSAPLDVAAALSVLGHLDRAFEWLTLAARQRVPQLIFLGVDPALEALQQDPRFDDCLLAMRLPRRAERARQVVGPP